jgi:predicted  nucleic acid-binding Zn-ribbon protein
VSDRDRIRQLEERIAELEAELASLQEIVSATTEQTGHNTERLIMLEQSIQEIRQMMENLNR